MKWLIIIILILIIIGLYFYPEITKMTLKNAEKATANVVKDIGKGIANSTVVKETKERVKESTAEAVSEKIKKS